MKNVTSYFLMGAGSYLPKIHKLDYLKKSPKFPDINPY